MDILDRLIQNTTNTTQLNSFLAKNSNSVELSDFFVSQSHQDLLKSKHRIGEFVLPNFNTFRNLEFSRSNTISFISYLIEFSERFGLTSEFEQLYNLHSTKKLDISSRLRASSLYLINITEFQNYSDRIPEILDLLKCAYDEEEDHPDTVIATFLNFYSQVVHNFASQNKERVIQLKTTLAELIAQDNYLFLNIELVHNCFNVSIDNNTKAFRTIQQMRDEYLSRTKKYLPFNVHTAILESDTDYVNLIHDETDKSFVSIQQLCSRLYRRNASTRVFRSLQRGVAVLTELHQLLAYMYSFGKMHNAKILSALDEANLSDEFNQEELEIYDWGCGQGVASYIFHEYYQLAHSNTILIEPSEIALKRAALHIKTIAPETAITTINKDLDSLLDRDFGSHPNKVKVHLFSNVLDIELFSMTQLLELIKRNFQGINYFICASPRVDQRRTNRLNNFMEFFRNEKGFIKYVDVDNSKGQWPNNHDWTRSIRVFKTEINNE